MRPRSLMKESGTDVGPGQVVGPREDFRPSALLRASATISFRFLLPTPSVCRDRYRVREIPASSVYCVRISRTLVLAGQIFYGCLLIWRAVGASS